MYYATRNEYSEIFHEFYKNLSEDNRDKIKNFVISFLQIGSSLGMDTLSGIVLGMYMVNELGKI